MDLTKKEAKFVINALKNGGIPSNYLGKIIISRENELKEIKRCLLNTKEGIGSFKIVMGKYGSGKTFLNHLVMETALRNDYIVSFFQLDRSFRLNKLEDLYYYIMHNLYLETADGEAKFDDIFNLWIENLKSSPDNSQALKEVNFVIEEMKKYNETFARALLSYIRSKIKSDRLMTETISSWLSGEQHVPYELKKKFGVIGHVTKKNVFDFLKAFSRLVELLGYNGLVIIIDELDLLLNERKDIRKDAYNNLKHLIDLVVSGKLSKTMFFLAGGDVLLSDNEKGLRSCKALSQRLGKAIDQYDSSMTDFRQPIVKLTNISLEQYKKITDKIVLIYKKAFKINLNLTNESIKNWVLYSYKQEKRNIRQLEIREFITRLIEILDIIQQNPENYIYRNNLVLSFKNGKPIFKNMLSKSKIN